MELTNKQKALKERRDYVQAAYINKPSDLATTSLVNALAKKFNVTSVCIYGDIKLAGKKIIKHD